MSMAAIRALDVIAHNIQHEIGTLDADLGEIRKRATRTKARLATLYKERDDIADALAKLRRAR
jgi:DNA polymerase III epsilon subunit-like protein